MHLDDDDDLRSTLRGADPSVRQESLGEATVRRLVAAAERDAPTPTSRGRLRRPRRRRLLLSGVATTIAAAVAGIALIGTLSTPAVQDPPPVMQGAPQSCSALTVDELRTNDVAFAGRVISVTGDTVTFTVTKTYAGSPGSTVTVAQISDDSNDDGADLFRSGRRYLVALADGDVAGCGQSGPGTRQLERLYKAAFTGGVTVSPSGR